MHNQTGSAWNDPKQGGGYPPQQGGYPPSQGQSSGIGFQLPQPGYPPQHGGYPPQQGGYPPQQGGYPPQQTAGYPPQQTAGYPPQQTAGYPPQQSGYPPQQGFPQSGYQQHAQPGYATSGYPPPQHGYAQAQASAGYPAGHAGGMATASALGGAMTRGTVTAFPGFNAESDANDLRKAMKGLGTDEKVLINILSKRTNRQRQEIKLKFKVSFGKDLEDNIRSEISGNFSRAVLQSMMEPASYDAYCLYTAMKGLGTDEHVLTEIMATRTNQEIQIIKQTYQQKYGKSLEDNLRSETSGHYQRALTSLCQGARAESNVPVDPRQAQADAQRLYNAGEGKIGTDESTFNQIFCLRSYPQLKAIFDEYKKISRRDLIDAVKSEMSGDLKKIMLTIIKVTINKLDYFAEALYNSMHGAGTDDTDLIRIVVSRSEIDLHDIKETFKRKYGKTLSQMVEGDTSGDYRRYLLGIIGPN